MPTVETDYVARLHVLALSLPRRGHLTPLSALPRDGIYLFFQEGESLTCDGLNTDRIVRVGTHVKDGRFRARIRQHYGRVYSLGGNRGGSVFRKHVGGAVLRKADPADPRLPQWLAGEGPRLRDVEAEVSRVLRERFTFVCFRVDSGEERLRIERGLIALLSRHPLGEPSADWLGRHAEAPEIREVGLWNVQHVTGLPINPADFARVEALIQATRVGEQSA
jgi:hypothetical protein